MTLAVSPALAQQQRIPDMSLTPQETLEQPNIVHGNGMPSNYQDYMNQQGGLGGVGGNDAIQQRLNQGLANGMGGMPGSDTVANNSFMANYCATGIQPLIGNNGALQSCLENIKQQSCSQYNTLPWDAKQVLNQTIDCLAVANDSELNGGTTPPQPNRCSNNDTARLQMIKKYWKDQNTAGALVFMPDQVLNGPAMCQGGR